MNKISSALLIILAALLSVPAISEAQMRSSATTKANNQNKAASPSRPVPSAAAEQPPTASASTVVSTSNSSSNGESCGCELPVPDVLAIVNETKLTIKDIETPENKLQEQVRSLQEQVTEARKRELDLLINSRLLEAEAQKRGTSTTKLLEGEVVAKVAPPTDQDAQTFYDQNKPRIRSEFKDVKEQIVAHLREQGQREEARKLAERLRSAAEVKIIVDKVTAPAIPAERARILATVSNAPITSGDVEDALRPIIYSVQEQVYAIRNEALERKINDILLAQEAQKRKVSESTLLDSEVKAKTSKISEADAQVFYTQNKDRISGEFAEVKNQVIQYLQTREETKALTQFAEHLRRGTSVRIFLASPEPPVYKIAVNNQPTKGNPAAQVTIVEFTDFQCPTCAQFHPVLEKITSEYADKVKLVVRDFPLLQHKQAPKAAEAAEAAREQGKYWEYVAILMNNQSALEPSQLKEYASQLNLDRRKFDEALDSGKYADEVQRDIRDGVRLGLNSTPSVFVNGRRVNEKTYESMKAAIESALKANSN